MIRRALMLLALAVPLGACNDASAPRPPAAIHGAVVLSPETIGVGELVNVELTAVTPPEHQIRPVELPESIRPLWLLDAERLPIRRDGERWIHTTRVRVRVREAPGRYEWPAQTLVVEDAAGETTELALEAVPFVVVSMSDALPDRLEPFGLRASKETPASAPSGLSRLIAALLGAAATLLLLAAQRLAVRRRAGRASRAEGPEDSEPAWTRADQELGAALTGVDTDPRAAADDVALCLRRYVQRRSGRPVEAQTTEEIAAQRPPGRLRTRWPEWVALLRRLDALRFPGHLDASEGRETLRALIVDARGFVERSIPPREMR